MDLTTIIIIGTVLFVVIGIFRSVAKSRKKAQARREAMDSRDGSEQPSEQAQQQQPMRAAAMSDIQRAFAMMAEEENPKPPPAKPAPPRPIPARAPAAYASVQGKSTFASGMQPHEGVVGKTEGRATTHEGKVGKTEGRATTHEGKAGKTEGSEFHGVGAHNMPNPYESVNISTITFDETEDDFGNAIGDVNAKPKPQLTLFEKQSDYVKAIIFSEILPRRNR
ncbi:MAG: hypothetical protein HN948_06260 [Clostridia bacterium]|jgi:hypothetical protein|nr:hypothetical protein [Clostridia bacterium]MBT7122600.1 hypothetical protein [Clostridia bacterium]